jgi:thiol-disulfide isomerase/thioredoxin
MNARWFHSIRLLLLNSMLAAALPCTVHAGSTRLLDGDSFAQVRVRYAHQPLIVHIWGLTCGPCLEELPRWGAIMKTYPDMNLVLIQADDAPIDAVGAALDRAGLGRIDPSWSGEMPRTQLISADGSITTIRGVVDPPVITRWLKLMHVAGNGVVNR